MNDRKENYYAIQVIGYGSRRRYAIQYVIPGHGTNPTTCRSYPTIDAAMQAAADNGWTIEKVGDFWEIT